MYIPVIIVGVFNGLLVEHLRLRRSEKLKA